MTEHTQISSYGQNITVQDTMHRRLEGFWDEHGERFAELVAVGGLKPNGWGYIHSSSDLPYGRQGLDRDEYLELIQLKWYLWGMCEILGPEAYEWVEDRINEEWDRVHQETADAAE